MIVINCPDCGAFVDEVYSSELPAEFDCATCGSAWTEHATEESSEESDELHDIEWEDEDESH